MAKVTGPLFSISASGTLGDTLTYSKQKCRHYVKGNRLELDGDYHFKQKIYDSQTVKQMAVREYFSNAVESWKNLSEEQKEVYINLAKGRPFTPISLYIKEYMNTNYSEAIYKNAYLFGIGAKEIVFLFQRGFETGLLLSYSRIK